MSDDTTTTPTTTPRPHVRAGSIAWGLIVVTTGALVLWVLSNVDRREAVADWVLALTPGGIAIVGVLAAIRRAQRRTS